MKLLRASYRAIKRGDRNALVVTGGVVHNNDRWLREAYRAGAKGFFDAVGTHPYQGVGDAAPETPDTGGEWWLMTHVKAVHELMASHSDGRKPIWFTEFGWSVHDNPAVIAALGARRDGRGAGGLHRPGDLARPRELPVRGTHVLVQGAHEVRGRIPRGRVRAAPRRPHASARLHGSQNASRP